LIFTIITLTLIPTGVAFGSHIFDDRDAFAQYLDIAQLSAEKYALKIDEKHTTSIMDIMEALKLM